jgi:substrate import-associated zinc metallohydrolase lipoprotein
LGTAEEGIRVVMYEVNRWNTDLSGVTPNSFYPMNPAGINYFHTLHHEMGHILHQRRPYTADFARISAGSYTQDDWNTTFDNDAAARRAGFISQYASKNPNEDFVELFSMFIVTTPEWWANMLAQAGTAGAEAITSKFDIVDDYMRGQWGLNLRELRRVISYQISRLPTIDFDLY